MNEWIEWCRKEKTCYLIALHCNEMNSGLFWNTHVSFMHLTYHALYLYLVYCECLTEKDKFLRVKSWISQLWQIIQLEHPVFLILDVFPHGMMDLLEKTTLKGDKMIEIKVLKINYFFNSGL